MRKGSVQMTMRKVSIIGAGYVGASIAYVLMLKEYADTIVLIDNNHEKAAAEVLDINHGMTHIKPADIYCGQFSDIAGSDLIIVTAGRNRKPDETRLDMTYDNLTIAGAVACEIKKYYNRGVVLIVSNPVDIITYKMTEWLDLPKGKVFGSGCILDVSRFSRLLADYASVNPDTVNARIIGEHGESQVILWSRTSVGEIPASVKHSIERQVIEIGNVIINGKGRTHYGIATCLSHLAGAILNGQTVTACVSSVLDGEYGLRDIALSLPCVIGRNGVTEILQDKIEPEEFEKLHTSAAKIREALICSMKNSAIR
jgi:L-lactate dehydrogenase